ncbi:hypothetical protein GIB67_039285, partial [Kingdonia uniflora]
SLLNIQEFGGPSEHCGTSIANVNKATQRASTAPTVIHVSRPVEVESNRKDLPIVMMEQEVMEAINESSAVIICGETGCGKTTQVPQFLYEAGYGSSRPGFRNGIIGVTQPRRVAVLATAKRVAFELGLHLGKEVGFQVRHDKLIGDSCTIKFMTDGILLREIQTDLLLKRYSVIILDEAHERSLNTDILIGMLSRIIPLRQELYREQQKRLLLGKNISQEKKISPLKLVLMSATLRVEDFTTGNKLFCVPPPVIEVPTRQFRVDIHNSRRTETVNYIREAYKKVISINKNLPPGGILVFVTGQREVEYLCEKLRKISKEMIKSKEWIGNEVTVDTETNFIDEEIDMKEISEAFEVNNDSPIEQNEDLDFLDEYDLSHNSDTESNISFDENDDENALKDASFADVLGEAGSLDSLKAAFEDLAGKSESSNNSEENIAVSKLSLPIRLKKNRAPNSPCVRGLSVLPLYAMLPATEQFRIFNDVKEMERLVVVATNVAETSLTIPGIKYVVDTGREKVKNYNSGNGMENYEVQWISKASAAQRAGRAGRTGPGHCYRLYSKAVFSNILSDFSVPEICKIPVDGVLLLMKSMGFDKVLNFPFPTPPEATALAEAESCLKNLEALNSEGRLTSFGKAMVHYPMSPRHSRMLLTVIQTMKNIRNYDRANLVLGYAIATAAALSMSDPFIMQFEGNHGDKEGFSQNDRSDKFDTEKIRNQHEKLTQKKLREKMRLARAKFCNPSSDALTIAYALQLFELAQSPVEFCQEHTLHLKTMEEMSKLRKQLLQLVFNQNLIMGSEKDFIWIHGNLKDVEQAWKISYDKHPLKLYEEEILGQAICAGWVDRVAKRIRVVSNLSDGDRNAISVRYQACVVSETVFLHRRSSVSQAAPEFLVYNELRQLKRPYMFGITRVKPEWLVKYARSMCSFSAPLTDPKPCYESLTDRVLCWFSATFSSHQWQLPLHTSPIKDDVLRASAFAYALLEGHVLPCLISVPLAAPPSSVFRPEAIGQRRVGNLLNKLKMKAINSRTMLKETWNTDPNELYSEIRDWFQEGFQKQFDERLWAQMHHEVRLEHEELFSNRLKKEKKKRKDAGKKN